MASATGVGDPVIRVSARADGVSRGWLALPHSFEAAVDGLTLGYVYFLGSAGLAACEA
jgi:hypothetical protein